MGLTIPTPGVTAGPEYAVDISDDLGTIANHTHTGASNNDGNQIPSAGINFNADLSAQSNNLTSLRSTRFADQSQVLAGIGDVGCVYEKSGDLWYNNSNGVPVQITSGSSLIAPVGGYTSQQISTNLTINSSSSTILVSADSTSNTITVTLPLANSVAAGRFYIIKDRKGTAATNSITVTPNGANTIDQANTSVVIRDNFGALCVVSDGTSNWLLFRYSTVVTPVVSTSTSITIPSGSGDAVYFLNVLSNSISITLPALSTVKPGVKILVKDSGAANITSNVINILPNGSDKIEGLNSTKRIQTPYGECWLQAISTSAGWIMI